MVAHTCNSGPMKTRWKDPNGYIVRPFFKRRRLERRKEERWVREKGRKGHGLNTSRMKTGRTIFIQIMQTPKPGRLLWHFSLLVTSFLTRGGVTPAQDFRALLLGL